MDNEDLIQALIFEYYGIRAANPNWQKTLAQFLISRGVGAEDARLADTGDQ